MTHKQPGITVDCVVFDQDDRLLLIERKNPPFQGQFALPGGFVEYGETTEAAAARELKEETSLMAGTTKLIGVYSRPDRDPRKHVITAAYLVSVNAAEPHAGDDAISAKFIADWKSVPLAFDHKEILADALKIR